MSSVTMEYGGISLIPVPFMTINKQYIKANEQGEVVDSLYNLSLDGHVVNISSGLSGTMQQVSDLQNTFATQGQLLQVKCGDEVLFQCYPRVKDLTFDLNRGIANSTNGAPYTITLDFDIEDAFDSDEDSSLHSPYLSSKTETWDMVPLDGFEHHQFTTASGSDATPYVFQVTHTLSAVGKNHYDGGGLNRSAWEEARQFIVDNLGIDNSIVPMSGVINFTASSSPYNHVRTMQVDERAGTAQATETWLVLNTSVQGLVYPVLENFDVEVQISNENDARNVVTVGGTIEGLDTKSFGSDPGDYSITETKYAAASGYWNAIADSLRIFPRANQIATLNSVTLNVQPLTKVVTHSPSQGRIGYNYTYNDRPSNCLTGVKSETFQVIDNNPSDIIAQFTVLGRSAGPILQDLQTSTPFTRQVFIEAVADSDDDCPQDGISAFLAIGNNLSSQISDVMCDFQTDLESSYDSVYKIEDTETKDIKEGRVSRVVTFQAANCTTAVNTSLC